MGILRDLVQGAPSVPDLNTSLAAAPITRGRVSQAEAADRSAAALSRNNSQWEMYDEVGEIAAGVRKQARVAGHAKLGIYRSNAKGAKEFVEVADLPENLRAISAALGSPVGGQRGLIERYWELIRVAGFCEVQAYGVNDGKRTPTGLQIRSADEIDRSNEKMVKLRRWPLGRLSARGSGVGEAQSETLEGSIIGQIWRPHPRFYDMPASPLWTMRTTTRQLMKLQKSIDGRLDSRLMMSGMHMWPNDLVDVYVPDNAPAEVKGAQSPLAKIVWMLTQFAMNPGSPEAAAGIHVQASPEAIAAYRFEDGYRALLEGDVELSEKLLKRVLDGMDTQVGAVVGRGEANHFSAWSDDAEEMRSNIIPGLEDFCTNLTRILFRQDSKGALVSASEAVQYTIWFDISDSQAMVNRTDNTRRGVEAGAISRKVLASDLKIGEDGLPDTEEQIRRIGEKTNDPYLALWGLDKIPDEVMEHAKEVAKTKKSGPAGDSGDSSRTPSQPGKGDPGSPSDDRSDRPGSSAPVD